MFNALPTAREVFAADGLPGRAAGYARDTATLGWEERMKVRACRASAAGFEFATALPRGTILRDGHCFVFDAAALVVHVVEQPEPVLVVRPSTPADWGLYAYHIGNNHQPI